RGSIGSPPPSTPRPSPSAPLASPPAGPDRPGLTDRGRRRRVPAYAAGVAGSATTVTVGDVDVRVSNPDKVFFPATGATKMDLVEYYLAVGPGALRGVKARPTVLKRYPNGQGTEPFFQKRVPESRPEWLQTATVSFPSGRTAEELCPADVAHIIWAVNLGCL